MRTHKTLPALCFSTPCFSTPSRGSPVKSMLAVSACSIETAHLQAYKWRLVLSSLPALHCFRPASPTGPLPSLDCANTSYWASVTGSTRTFRGVQAFARAQSSGSMLSRSFGFKLEFGCPSLHQHYCPLCTLRTPVSSCLSSAALVPYLLPPPLSLSPSSPLAASLQPLNSSTTSPPSCPSPSPTASSKLFAMYSASSAMSIYLRPTLTLVPSYSQITGRVFR